jgi:toxin ParE1/3/4
MKRRVDRRPQAKLDLIELGSYIAEDNPDAAERFLQAAEASFRQLANMPEMGSPRQFKNPSLAGLRMWPVKGFRNHLIFYRPTADGIEVIRVLRGERDLESIFADEEDS